MSLKGKVLLHGKTDVGSFRDHNEDAIGCDEDIGLAVLADGMGGHRGGEVASQGDHRIAMAFAVAGCNALGPVMIRNTTNVATSFPGFVEAMLGVGARIVEV